MTAFKNNLKRGDEVYDVDSKRTGHVNKAPWGKLRAVEVKFRGIDNLIRRCDVTNLRLVVDGKPEDVAPFDGEPPSLNGKRVADTPPEEVDGLTALKGQRAKLKAKMDAMNEEFKALRILIDRTDRAIAALEGTEIRVA